MTAKYDELLALEKQFWTGGLDVFRVNTDKECLVAFTQMAGVMSNDDLAETARNPLRWKELEIELKGIVEPSNDVVLLTYEASAVRESGDAY
jgi:hypothetical protein